jgi:DNA-directed RNA polymerase
MESIENRELALEIKGYAEVIKRKRADLKGGPLGHTGVGTQIIREILTPLVLGIQKEQKKVERGSRKRYGFALVSIEAEKLALITLRTIFRVVAQVDSERPAATQTQLVGEIGRACEQQHAFDRMSGEQRDLVALWLKRVKKRWNALKQIREQAKRLRKKGWPTYYLGAALVALALRHSGLIEKRHRPKKSATIHLTVRARRRLHRLLKEGEALVWPALKPMLHPPVPWTGAEGGGYKVVGLPLVKHHDRPEVVSALKKSDLQVTCEAVNALQETPWRLNVPILALMEARPGRQGSLGGFEVQTSAEDPRIEEEGIEESDPRVEAKASDLECAREIQNATRLVVARAFAGEKEFFFPYQLDWRGRCYALPSTLHPQSDDESRALLLFARGKPLGDRGAYWLAVHLANLYGNGKDKQPFSERVRWIQESGSQIMDAVDRPYESEFIRRADKPWRFLAAAFEWVGYLREGPGFMSHVPVAMDGTCNGLQHLSALGRDPEGGRSTNLIPGSGPCDIYQEVADRLIPRVQKACTTPNFDVRALFWRGILDRKYVKQPTMTTPYGVRGTSIRKQLMATMLERHPDRFREDRDRWVAADYLAPLVERAIAEVVVKAAEIMTWLREVVQELGKQGRVASWVTPAGFPVVNKYPKLVVRRIDTLAGALTLRVADPKGKLDGPKQMDSIVPNLIHSLDAAHMMFTVGALKAEGLSDFAMVHDSYAVHASDVDRMNRVLREQFVRVHQECTLARLTEQFREGEAGMVINDPPPLGSLDLGDVVRSEYFFS